MQATIFILFCGIALSFGQTVSEEARRHFYRGQAAVEMAKSPEDYAAAIEEFEQAARLAPGWPDPYYNLGLVQEKAGKFREAIVSLNRYLQLAPNAPDAAKIQEHIYKLEYKAERENILTIADIVDVLVSFGNEETWEIEKRGKHEQNATFVPCAVCGGFHICTFITRLDNDRIKVPRMIVHTKNGYRAVEEESFNIIKIKGPVVKFSIVESYVGYPVIPPYRAARVNVEIEVVSKTHVKVGILDGVGETFEALFTAEYRK